MPCPQNAHASRQGKLWRRNGIVPQCIFALRNGLFNFRRRLQDVFFFVNCANTEQGMVLWRKKGQLSRRKSGVLPYLQFLIFPFLTIIVPSLVFHIQQANPRTAETTHTCGLQKHAVGGKCLSFLFFFFPNVPICTSAENGCDQSRRGGRGKKKGRKENRIRCVRSYRSQEKRAFVDKTSTCTLSSSWVQTAHTQKSEIEI